MKLGLCASVDKAAAAKAAGFDYIEASVQGLLRAHDQQAGEWMGAAQAAGSELPIPAANLMVPASLKITGPDADPKALAQYMSVMLSRAQRVGIRTIVFGSGGARMVPDGFPKAKAYDQIVSFLSSAAPIAFDRDIVIVIEPLNKTECNILNGIVESADIARRVNHPGVKLLWDTYHYWMDQQDFSELTKTVDLVHHVHLADLEGRVAPGLSGKSDYAPIFKLLRQHGYKGRISLECKEFDLQAQGPSILEYIRKQWDAAA